MAGNCACATLRHAYLGVGNVLGGPPASPSVCPSVHPVKIDSSNPQDPMGQLAVVLLTLFGQMERTYTLERAAHARAVATASGRRVGRPSVVDPDKLAYAVHLRDTGHTLAQIVTKTGIAHTSLYRHMPARELPPVTADAAETDPT